MNMGNTNDDFKKFYVRNSDGKGDDSKPLQKV